MRKLARDVFGLCLVLFILITTVLLLVDKIDGMNLTGILLHDFRFYLTIIFLSLII